jgi:hypothetical protein
LKLFGCPFGHRLGRMPLPLPRRTAQYDPRGFTKMRIFPFLRSGNLYRLAQFATITLSVFALIVATLPVAANTQSDTQTAQGLVNIDLGATSAGITFFGAGGSDHLSGNAAPGTSATFPRAHAIVTGDFNRDGSLDVAIGAPDADFAPTAPAPARPNAGAVYILFGKSTFPANAIIDTSLTATNQPDVKIFGAASDDNLGFALAAGDVNGDGGTDLVIGAPGFDPSTGSPATTQANAGAVHILFGATTLTPKIIDLNTPNSTNVVIFGEHSGDRFGSAIAVGDVTGGTPAVADLLVGAPASTGPAPAVSARADGGAAFLLNGGDGLNNTGATIKTIDLGSTAAALRIFGNTGSQLGSSVAIGDINSAGPSDIIVGAPKSNRPNTGGDITETGAVFAIFGGANITPAPPATSKVIDINSTQQNVSIYGESSGDHLGASVATGNVRGGGVIDLIMGAPEADGPSEGRANAGEIYILAGSTGLNTPNDPPAPGTPIQRRIDVSLGTVNLTVYGAQSGDRFGSTVAAGVFNITGNADAIADVLAGAPGFSSSKGAVYALFGGANLTFFAARDLAIGQDDIRVSGQANGDELGWAIATGDIDNNLGGDLILGAPFADATISEGNTRTDAGKVYVLLAAGNVVPPVNQNPTVMVTNPNTPVVITGGSTVNINWTASDPNGDATIQRFEIRLSTDSGVTFNTIITSNVDGTLRTFPWIVPTGLNTQTARIRVTAFDNAGGTGQDDSDVNFQISDAGVGVIITAPIGGETLIQGTTFNITWNVPEALRPQVKGFDLFFAADGTNFVPITPVDPTKPALEATVFTFPWVVPNVCTSTAKVLVRATSITNAISISTSGAFTIGQRGPTVDLTGGNIFFNSSGSKLNFRITTINGIEVRFADGVKLEISNDAAGTQFFEVAKTKDKSSGNKLQAKGKVNDQKVGDFFPDGAIRLVRITNPTCGVTLLRLKRVGNVLVQEALPVEIQNFRVQE